MTPRHKGYIYRPRPTHIKATGQRKSNLKNLHLWNMVVLEEGFVIAPFGGFEIRELNENNKERKKLIKLKSVQFGIIDWKKKWIRS